MATKITFQIEADGILLVQLVDVKMYMYALYLIWRFACIKLVWFSSGFLCRKQVTRGRHTASDKSLAFFAKSFSKKLLINIFFNKDM